MAVTTVLLKGTLYLRKVGEAGLLSTGNATKISMAAEIEEITVPNAEIGGGNHDTFKRPKSVKLNVSFRNMTRAVAQIAFGAKITDIPSSVVVDEPHTDIILGSLIPTVKRQDLAIAMVVKKGATVLTEGLDYQRKRAGIIPLVGGTLIAGDDITIGYTSVKVARIDGMMVTSNEFYGLFDGINERIGEPALGEMYRLAFGPATNVELIGEQFASFDCTAELLADDSKPVTESPFYHFEMGGID